MQNVKFRNVDEFLEYLPLAEKQIVEQLRSLVFEFAPAIQEKLSYNVPFYKKNKGMFFIWPASILWGKKKTFQGVRFGFQQGYLLNDTANYLDRGNRKQVYWKDFKKLKENDFDLLKSYICDAIILDKKWSPKNKM